VGLGREHVAQPAGASRSSAPTWRRSSDRGPRVVRGGQRVGARAHADDALPERDPHEGPRHIFTYTVDDAGRIRALRGYWALADAQIERPAAR
jgi:hypothetical protein